MKRIKIIAITFLAGFIAGCAMPSHADDSSYKESNKHENKALAFERCGFFADEINIASGVAHPEIDTGVVKAFHTQALKEWRKANSYFPEVVETGDAEIVDFSQWVGANQAVFWDELKSNNTGAEFKREVRAAYSKGNCDMLADMIGASK